MDTTELNGKILRLLYDLGEAPKKTLHTAFVTYSDAHYSRTITKLQQDGYITQRKRDDKVQVALTAKGIATVREMDPDCGPCKYVRDSDFMRRRRDDMYATAVATMMACKIIVSGTQMPDMELLLSAEIDGEARSRELAKLELATKQGLFISSANIRKCCLLLGEQAEYLNGARFLGVLIVKTTLIYVYNVKKYLIRFSARKEKMAIDTVERVLARLDGTSIQRVAKDASDRPQMARSAIIFATEKSMLVKIYRGDHYGKNDYGTLTRQQQAQKKYRKKYQASYDNLSRVFNPIYFATCDIAGAKILRRIQANIMFGENPNQAILNRMHLQRDSNTSFASYDPSNNRDVVPLGLIDIDEIDAYVNEGMSRGYKYTVVGPKYYVDPISRCFGATIKEYIDSSTMKPVKMLHYDNSGRRVGKHPIDRLFAALDESKEGRGGV